MNQHSSTIQRSVVRSVRISTIAALLAVASSAMAATEPEFDGLCATGLAIGSKIKTSCSVDWTNPADGKRYCFSNADAKDIFLQNETVNLRRAHKQFGRQ